MVFEQSAKGGITMEQARYFVNYDEKPVIEDFKAKVNVYGTDEGGRVFLAAVAVGEYEAEAVKMARKIVELMEREAWAKRRMAEIDGAIEALDRGRDLSQAFPGRPEGEMQCMKTRNAIMAVNTLDDRIDNYRRTVSRLQTEREALYQMTGEWK